MRTARLLAIGVMLVFASYGVALAQTSPKTWVSTTGSDSGICGINSPCATLQYAYNQTIAGGEIEVKDSGQFGSLIINRAVSVISSGAAATIGVGQGGVGILVSAGATDIVTLRGLIINGHSTSGTYGIQVTSGKDVIIDKCIIEGNSYGMYFIAPNTYVMITNNLITQNSYGIDLGQIGYAIAGGNRIAGNGVGIYNGTIHTYGDNDVNTNTTADESSVTSSTVSKY